MHVRELKALNAIPGLTKLCRAGTCGYRPYTGDYPEEWQGIKVADIRAAIGDKAVLNIYDNGCPWSNRHDQAEGKAEVKAEAGDAEAATKITDEQAERILRKLVEEDSAAAVTNLEAKIKAMVRDDGAMRLLNVLMVHHARTFGFNRESYGLKSASFSAGKYDNDVSRLLWIEEWCSRYGFSVEAHTLQSGVLSYISVELNGDPVQIAIEGMGVDRLHDAPEPFPGDPFDKSRAVLSGREQGSAGIDAVYTACRTLQNAGGQLQIVRGLDQEYNHESGTVLLHRGPVLCVRFILPTVTGDAALYDAIRKSPKELREIFERESQDNRETFGKGGHDAGL